MTATSTATVNATLKDNAGDLIAGETYAFSYEAVGSTSQTSAGTAVTGANGVASVIISGLTPGGVGYNFFATFAGDNAKGLGGSNGSALAVILLAGTTTTVSVTSA